MKMKKIFQNLGLLFITVIIIFIAGEVTLRLMVSEESGKEDKGLTEDPRGLSPDSVLNRVHMPNHKFTYVARDGKEFKTDVEYNSKGLNDSEYSYYKPEGTTRIAVLGDSFTEALQVRRENNFCEIMERELNEKNPRGKYEVINMGVSGYSPILEYVFLQREGIKYSPDIVVMCFFMNDVYEDSVYKGMAAFDSSGLPVSVHWAGKDKAERLPAPKALERKACSAVKNFLKKSKFYVFLKSRTYVALTRLGLREKEEYRRQFFIIENAGQGDETGFWANSFRYILATRDLAASRGADFLLVIIPIEAQLVERPDDATFRTYFREKCDSRRANGLLETFCGNNDIQCVNLFYVFRDYDPGGLYFKNDGHFRQEGHRVAAEAILEKLYEANMLR